MLWVWLDIELLLIFEEEWLGTAHWRHLIKVVLAEHHLVSLVIQYRTCRCFYNFHWVRWTVHKQLRHRLG